jgi:hypothetical protein
VVFTSPWCKITALGVLLSPISLSSTGDELQSFSFRIRGDGSPLKVPKIEVGLADLTNVFGLDFTTFGVSSSAFSSLKLLTLLNESTRPNPKTDAGLFFCLGVFSSASFNARIAGLVASGKRPKLFRRELDGRSFFWGFSSLSLAESKIGMADRGKSPRLFRRALVGRSDADAEGDMLTIGDERDGRGESPVRVARSLTQTVDLWLGELVEEAIKHFAMDGVNKKDDEKK